MPQVQKRDGTTLAGWNPDKITQAMAKAFKACSVDICEEKLHHLTAIVIGRLPSTEIIPIEKIQDEVEETLMLSGYWKVARAYAVYRERRRAIREGKDELMDIVADIDRETSRDNANVGPTMAGKVLQISEAASSHYYLTRVIPRQHSEAHDSGNIYIHDRAWYGKGMNCVQIPLEKLLATGFHTGHGFIRPPRSMKTAAMQAAIILQANQNEMYGGQSYPDFDNQMAATGVIDVQREKICRDLNAGLSLIGMSVDDFEGKEALDQKVEQILDRKGYQGMEALIYNLNTMHSRGGGQVPFTSLNIGNCKTKDAAKVCEWVLRAYEAGLGKGEQPIFPNICFKLKAGVNMNPGDPYYYLKKLAIKVSAYRLNPSFVFMDASFNKDFDVAYMGCRTRVVANNNGPSVVTGRGNISFATINLPRIGIQARLKAPSPEVVKVFMNILDEQLALVIDHLLTRYRYLCDHLKAKDFPFLIGQGLYMDSEKLKPEDSIEGIIKHGTLSLGFIGLAEALTAMFGEHHGNCEDYWVREVGLKIIKRIRDAADLASKRSGLNFSVIGTPAEGLSGKFVDKDRKLFGSIPGVTDREYYTNSFHVPVNCPISSYEKIRIEGAYHKYCNGGHISYVELGAMPPQMNLDAIEAIIDHMADSDMGYAAINFPVDRCCSCNDDRNVIPEDKPCPRCGETENISRVRRITGYLSEITRFNDAKLAEEHARVPHV